MKSLITIQKTFKVFKTLSMIAMIISFIAAGTALLGLSLIHIYQYAASNSICRFALSISQ